MNGDNVLREGVVQNPMQPDEGEEEVKSQIESMVPWETSSHLEEETKKERFSYKILLQRLTIVFVLIVSSICIDLFVAYNYMALGEDNSIHLNLDVQDTATVKYQLQSQDNEKGAINVDGNFNINFNPLLSEPYIYSVVCDIMYQDKQAFSVVVDASQRRQQNYIASDFGIAVKDIDYTLTRLMMRDVALYRKNDTMLHALCSVDGALKLFSTNLLHVPITLHETEFEIPFGATVQYVLDELFKATDNDNSDTHKDGENDAHRTPADLLKHLTPSWLQNFPQPRVDTFNHRESKLWWDMRLHDNLKRFLNSNFRMTSMKLTLPTLDYSFRFGGMNFTEHDMNEIREGMQKVYNVSSKIAAKSRVAFPRFPYLNISSMDGLTVPDLDVILNDLSEMHGLLQVNSSSTVGSIDFAKDSALSVGFTIKCPLESSAYCNIFTPALMPSLGKNSKIKMHTDNVDFVTSLFGPYHYISKTVDVPIDSSSSVATVTPKTHFASRHLDDEHDDCDEYDIDGIVTIRSCDTMLTIFDDGGDIITADLRHESTRIFSNYVHGPDIIVVDMRIDHQDGLFNGDMRVQNYKIGINPGGDGLNIMGNASLVVHDDYLEINIMWGKETEYFFQDPYDDTSCDLRNIGHEIYWFQSSAERKNFENVVMDDSNDVFDSYSYHQDFKFAENNINDPMFMMNHSLKFLEGHNEKAPMKVDYKYEIPQFDVVIGFSSSEIRLSNNSYDADLYFLIDSTEIFRLSTSYDYFFEDLADYHCTLNSNMKLTTDENNTIFSLDSEALIVYTESPSVYFDFAGSFCVHDESNNQIFRLSPTISLIDYGKLMTDVGNVIHSRNSLQVDVSGDLTNIEANCDIHYPSDALYVSGDMRVGVDSEELFRLSPILRAVSYNETSRAEKNTNMTNEVAATLRVVVEGNHEVASIHMNSSSFVFDDEDFLHTSTVLNIESDEVFRLSPSIRVADANTKDRDHVDVDVYEDGNYVDVNVRSPLFLFGEDEPTVNIWIQALARHWRRYVTRSLHADQSHYEREAELFHVKTGHMTLTLPKSDPDWSLKIFEVIDLALKTGSGGFNYHNLQEYGSDYVYIGVSQMDFVEALEASGSTLSTGDDYLVPSVVEMDMKIHTVDMSMAMLIDFENSYVAMNMQADESADWDMNGMMGVQLRPTPASLSELATGLEEGVVTYAEADMSMDGESVMDPYEYGELREVTPFDKREKLGAPLDFSWINTTLTSINVEFQARDCPVNPRPKHSSHKDVFDFRAEDISVTKNDDSSYLVYIQGFRRYFGRRGVSMKTVFTNDEKRLRSYGRLSDLGAETDPFLFTQVIESDPIEFDIKYIRLKLYDASKRKGSKRVLSCIDLVL